MIRRVHELILSTLIGQRQRLLFFSFSLQQIFSTFSSAKEYPLLAAVTIHPHKSNGAYHVSRVRQGSCYYRADNLWMWLKIENCLENPSPSESPSSLERSYLPVSLHNYCNTSTGAEKAFANNEQGKSHGKEADQSFLVPTLHLSRQLVPARVCISTSCGAAALLRIFTRIKHPTCTSRSPENSTKHAV